MRGDALDAAVVTCGHRGEHLGEVLVAAAAEGHERDALAPGSCSTQAIACAGSSAGMIPSRRDSSRNAASASSSVTDS